MNQQQHHFQDARLKKALKNAPGQNVQPQSHIRASILDAAKKAIESPARSQTPVKPQLNWLERVSQYLFGSPRMAWSALGSFLVVGVVALLWSINDPKQALEQGDLLETKAPPLPNPARQDTTISQTVVVNSPASIEVSDVDKDVESGEVFAQASTSVTPAPVMPASQNSQENNMTSSPIEEKVEHKTTSQPLEQVFNDQDLPANNVLNYADKRQHNKQAASKTSPVPKSSEHNVLREEMKGTVSKPQGDVAPQENLWVNSNHDKPADLKQIEPDLRTDAIVASGIAVDAEHSALRASKSETDSYDRKIYDAEVKTAAQKMPSADVISESKQTSESSIIVQRNDNFIVADTGKAAGFGADAAPTAIPEYKEPEAFPSSVENKAGKMIVEEKPKLQPEINKEITKEDGFSSTLGASTSQNTPPLPPAAAIETAKYTQEPRKSAEEGFVTRQTKNQSIQATIPITAKPTEESKVELETIAQRNDSIEKMSAGSLVQNNAQSWQSVRVTLPDRVITKTFTRKQAKELSSFISHIVSATPDTAQQLLATEFKPTSGQVKLVLLSQKQTVVTIYLDAKNWYRVSTDGKQTEVLKGSYSQQQLNACIEYINSLAQ